MSFIPFYPLLSLLSVPNLPFPLTFLSQIIHPHPAARVLDPMIGPLAAVQKGVRKCYIIAVHRFIAMVAMVAMVATIATIAMM